MYSDCERSWCVGSVGVTMKVLMSIKPEYVRRIFSGEKKYEFRRKLFRRDVNAVVVYATLPVGKVYGEFRIAGIIKGAPLYIWRKCCRSAGISKKDFLAYFKGSNSAYALVVGAYTEYRRKTSVAVKYHRRPPQSYVYVEG